MRPIPIFWSESARADGGGGGGRGEVCLREGGVGESNNTQKQCRPTYTYDEQETHVTVVLDHRETVGNKQDCFKVAFELKESGDAVWRSDGGRLFQDVGPVYVKAHCPAEESTI